MSARYKKPKILKTGYAVRATSAVLGVVILLTAAACTGRDTGFSVPPETSTPLPPSLSPIPSATHLPTILPTFTQMPLPEPSPTLPAPDFQMCSPLEGVELVDLEATISNPFHPPRTGSDEPHHGVDLAHLGADRVALAGLPVLATLNGRVAGVIHDRFPYGNALIVETPLDELSPELRLHVPEIAPLPDYVAPLTCPPAEIDMGGDQEKRSLYLLYAHLQQPPSLQTGDQVTCGAPLGTIGDSGNALNPHLHLEMRTGPAGARIPSLSHYDPGATSAEMAAYCTWRISGYFQMFDPMILFLALWESP